MIGEEVSFMETWLVILIVIGAYFVVVLLYSLIIYFVIIAKVKIRADKNPLFKYFTYEDFAGLQSENFTFKNKSGTNLTARKYTREGLNDDTYIIFFHGFGGGHEAYTTLINDLILNLGMPVLTFDYTGCDLSEGKNMKNIYQPLADANDFLNYLQEVPEYKDKKLILIGHSLGGFVATNLLPFNKDKNIIKVIGINPVTDFGLYFKNIAKAPAVFAPMFKFFSAFKYGKFAFANTRESIKNTRVPHLIMHGAKDDFVPFSPLISNLVLQKDDYHQIKFHFENEKKHSLYLTLEGEKALAELMGMLNEYKKGKNRDETLKQKILDFDFSRAVEDDEQTLYVIKHFVEGK